MADPRYTTGKHPVPTGQTCQWPGCANRANGSAAIGSQGTDRLYLCIDHLAHVDKLMDEFESEHS